MTFDGINVQEAIAAFRQSKVSFASGRDAAFRHEGP
jgi:hypothetical protein